MKPKLAIEGTNYALVEKKKTAVGEYRLEWGKKRFSPVREKTLDTASKEIRSKISPFVRHSFTAITRNNRLLIVEYIYILMEMMGFARQTFQLLIFWCARIFFLFESTKLSLISIEMERHSQLRRSKS